MKIKQYIDQNSTRIIRLDELSKLSELSPSFLCRIFKSIIGITPVEYINKQKVFTAKLLLLETDKTVKEVSYQCGFENTNYFYEVFKKYECMTPLDYRIKNANTTSI
jgi:YesN/AraC family two-component response regulator